MASLSRLDRCVPTGFGTYVRFGVHKLVAAVAASALLIGVAPAVVAQTEDAVPSTESAPAVVVPAEDDDSTIEPAPVAAAQDGDTAFVQLQLHALENEVVSSRTDFYSGEAIAAEARVSSSGTGAQDGVIYTDVTLTVTIPKNEPYVKKSEIQIKDSLAVLQAGGQCEVQKETADAIVKSCFLPQYSGAAEISMPHGFKFENYITPDGVTQEVRFSVKSANGALNKEISKTYTAKATSEYNVFIEHIGQQENIAVAGEQGVGLYADYGQTDSSNATHTSAVGVVTTHLVHISEKPLSGAHSGLGIYRAKTATYTVKLPAEAEFYSGSGWEYNSSNHTVTATFERDNGRVCSYAANFYRSYCRDLKLIFKNAPLQENGLHKIYRPSATAVIDKGESTERSALNGEVYDKVAFEASDWPRDSRFYFDKKCASNCATNASNKYFDGKIYPANTKIEDYLFVWALAAGNENNGSAPNQNPRVGGKTNNLKEIIDDGLSATSYYHSIVLSQGNFWNRYVTQYSPLTSAERDEYINSLKPKLIGVDEQGSEVVLRENMVIGETVEIDDSQRKYVQLIVRFDNPLVLDNFAVYARVATKLISAEQQKWINGEHTTSQSYENWMRVKTADESGAETLSKRDDHQPWTSPNRVNVAPVDPRVRQELFFNGTTPQSQQVHACDDSVDPDCNTVTLNAYFSPYGGTAGWAGLTDDIKNAKQIILLPDGIEYLKTNKTRVDNKDVFNIEPLVIKNYKNTGKTALIYSYGDLNNRAGGMNDCYNHTCYSQHVQSNFNLRVNNNSQSGTHIIESFAIWDNNDVIKPMGSGNADIYDLDDDGDTSEMFIRKEVSVKFVPPLELLGYTSVKAGGGDFANQTLAADLGSELKYRLRILNNTTADVKNLTFVQLLPAPGDRKIMHNEQGVYPKREWSTTLDDGTVINGTSSAFKTPLTKAIEDVTENSSLNSRFEFLYSITPQRDDIASVVNGPWLTKEQITSQHDGGWDKVTAYKIVLKDGQKIDSKETINVYSDNKIPFDEDTKGLHSGSKAVSSMVLNTTTNTALNMWLETNEVTTEIVKYSVSGVVFNDIDKNGSRCVTPVTSDDDTGAGDGTDADSGAGADNAADTGTGAGGDTDNTNTDNQTVACRVVEPGLAEYEVALFNAKQSADTSDGNSEPTRAVHPDGSVIESVNTDGEGKYSFEVYTRGSYKVGFRLKGTNQPFTFPGKTGDVATDSHVVNRAEANTAVGNLGLTDEFRLHPLHRHAVLNAGVQVLGVDIPLLKVEKFKQHQDGKLVEVKQPLKDTEFTLAWKEPLTGETVADKDKPQDQTLRTDGSGKLTFTEVRYGVYTLTETKRAGYVAAGPWTVTVDDKGVTVTGKNSNDTSAVVVEDDSSAGEVASLKVTNTRIQGSVSLVKVDSQKSDVKLAGAIFQLFAKTDTGFTKPLYTLPATDSNGYTKLEGIDYGTYVLKETGAPAHYVATFEPREIEITTHGQELKIGEVANRIYQGKVIAVKQDADTGEKLAGAVFGLFKVTKDAQSQETVAATPSYTATSGSDGRIEFAVVDYGVYELQEITAPTGYVLGTKTTRVVIHTDGQVVDLTQDGNGNAQAIPNTINKSHVKVVKVDSADSTVKLEGVTFGLFKTDTNGAVPEGSEPAYTAVTGRDGIALFADVRYGDYELRELSTLVNYVLSTDTRDVKVHDNGVVIELGNFANTLLRGSVTIAKQGESGQGLAGAVFGLYRVKLDDEGKPVTDADGGYVLADADAAEYTVTTDSNGRAVFTDVLYGAYVVKEIKAPTGYVVNDSDVRLVQIVRDGDSVDFSGKPFVNELVRADVIVLKTGVDGAVLRGAVFELRDGDGNTVAREKSDSAGRVRFVDVVFGEYELVEVKAPRGFVLDSTPRPVVVSEDGVTVDLGVVVNEQQPDVSGGVVKPIAKALKRLASTGGQQFVLWIAGGVAVVVGVLLLVVRRRQRDRK